MMRPGLSRAFFGLSLATVGLAGCGIRGAVIRDPTDERAAAQATPAPAATPSSQAIFVESLRRYVDILERTGVLPLNVEVRDPGYTLRPGVRIRIFDDTLEEYGDVTGRDGVAHVQVPTTQLSRWEIEGTAIGMPGYWVQVPRPQILPLKSGMGLRAVILLPPPPTPPPVLTPAPIPTPPIVTAPADLGRPNARLWAPITAADLRGLPKRQVGAILDAQRRGDLAEAHRLLDDARRAKGDLR